ncbi:MAG: transcriptional regulator [Candidatus Nezhaarchaeota archaeon]|nr:transcriptional regulator [Candidatus Nezhaarchaeota archaeon]MCX8141650.1 transcriptional regulator [Candidatus Nezhaarchaeota archaeon]MDW8049917.1 transcriptional regulator [Nitrososphaerota archaeon]
MNSKLTIREQIMVLLKTTDRPLTANDIALILGLKDVKPKDIYEHLKHVAKTIKAQSGGKEALVMIPPSCKSCGYTFTGLDRPKKPSKCPNCKSERITPPAFKIISVS